MRHGTCNVVVGLIVAMLLWLWQHTLPLWCHNIYCDITQCMNALWRFISNTELPTLGQFITIPDSKVHGSNMGPTWVLSAPCWPHEPCYQGWSTSLQSNVACIIMYGSPYMIEEALICFSHFRKCSELAHIVSKLAEILRYCRDFFLDLQKAGRC